MLRAAFHAHRSAGFTLLEVLIAMVVLAFGLLSLATLQSKAMVWQLESFQRAQAIQVLNDLSARISANAGNAASYLTSAPLGTGDTQPSSCLALSVGSPRDLCEWSASLKGSAEQKSGVLVGAMVGARGCVTQIRATDATAGVCTPGIYAVTVVWQGLNSTIAPTSSCGASLYGSDDGLRRAISTRVLVPLSAC